MPRWGSRRGAGARGGEAGPRVEPLARADRSEALAHLRQDPRGNLFLIDLLDLADGQTLPGEPAPRLLVGRDAAGGILGIASQRPAVVLDSGLDEKSVAPFLPVLAAIPAGLVRSLAPAVAPLWRELSRRGRRALVDRAETAFLLDPVAARFADPPPEIRWRAAETHDLAALVEAARASLREEGRPDPFEGDARGFRRWVRARLPRALVGERRGEIVFVGYGDVRRPEGWLIQGVYTWPHVRRRGIARAGVSALCRNAFAEGADHVQLSVVEGNQGGERLYAQLGFQPFAALRTLLFA